MTTFRRKTPAVIALASVVACLCVFPGRSFAESALDARLKAFPKEVPAFAPAARPTPPVTDKIVFISNRDGAPEIYAMDPDGSNVKQLTHDKSMKHFLAVSPDGAWIAFSSAALWEYRLSLVDIEGNQLHTVVDAPEHKGMGICWLPDGKILSVVVPYAAVNQATHFLVKIPAFGGRVEPLPLVGLPAGVGPFIGDLALSPDSKTLCFSWSDLYSESPDLGLAPLDGSAGVRRITKPGNWPAWSPDGTRIAFGTHRNDKPGIFVTGTEGGEAKLLTETKDDFYGCSSPAWSPTGDKLVFLREKSEYRGADFPEHDMKICAWDLKAGKQTDLTDKPSFFYASPRWIKGTGK